MSRNITTDGPLTLDVSKGTVLLAVPEAIPHLNHRERMEQNDAIRRKALNDASDENRERISASHAEEANLAREYEKYGAPTTTDADGKTVAVDWRKPFEDERKRLKAANEYNSGEIKKISPSQMDALNLFCARNKRRWRSIAMETVADVSNILAVTRGRAGFLKAVEREEREVENANRTDAETEAAIRAEFQRLMKAGALDFRSLLQGGSFRHDGSFSAANPGARLGFPTQAADVYDAQGRQVTVEVVNAPAMFARYGDSESILENVLKDARAANAGKPQISESDKVRLLREIAVRKLAAQRSLEAAYRAAEAHGLNIKRRELPPEVLLWLELDTSTPTPRPKAKVASVEEAPAAADFDFEDAND